MRIAAPPDRPALYFNNRSTALANSLNSARAGDDGAYSAIVSPDSTASANAILCPIPGSSFFPIASSDAASPRPRFVFIGALDGTNRIRGFFDRLSARAFSARFSASFSANKSSLDGPHGSSITSAASAAAYAVSGIPGGVSITRSSTSFAAFTAARNPAGDPSFTFATHPLSQPSPCPAQAARLCCGSASSTSTFRPFAIHSPARFRRWSTSRSRPSCPPPR